ncbi:MAG: serine hydrolase domain-containing protein [Acidobacteriota bacterium]
MQEITRRSFLGTTALVGTGRMLGFPMLAAAEPASGSIQAIDAFVNRHLRERGAPGLILGLADRERVLAARPYGHRDIKTGQPVESGDLFEIGSITKSFIAISLLQLREAGRLDLDRPIREYLPWLRIESSYAPITVHHLLTHSSGLPNPLSWTGIPLWTSHAPGEHFHYCNLGYDILGRLLETLDGRRLREILPARIFQPLGMTSTAPVIAHDLRSRMPVSYWPLYDDRPFQRHGPLAEAPYLAMDNAAGCVVSTAGDMALYMRMLLNRGRPVLSEESFALFSKPAIPAPSFGEGAGYGYGIAVQPVEGRTLLRHTGGMVSFSSAMQVDLDAGFGAFASVNASLAGYRPNPVAAYSLAALRAERENRPLPPMPEPDDPYKVPNTGDYVGTYTAPDGRKLVLSAEGDLLRLVLAGERAGERIPLERLAPDTFFVSHPDFALFALGFGRDGKGAVVEASYGEDWYAGERYAGPRAFETPAEWRAFAGHYRNDSPWEGSARIALRNGRLWIGGDTPLVPLGADLFRIGDEEHSPDRVRFGNVVNGRALVATFNGVDYRRIET